MARRYAQFTRSEGIIVPRWVVYVLVLLALLWFAARIFVAPSWMVQRLDAPDGSHAARLMREIYVKHHFVVEVKSGWTWQTVYYSEPIPAIYTEDLGERLSWSPDSRYLRFKMGDELIWGYDFAEDRVLPRKAKSDQGRNGLRTE